MTRSFISPTCGLVDIGHRTLNASSDNCILNEAPVPAVLGGFHFLAVPAQLSGCAPLRYATRLALCRFLRQFFRTLGHTICSDCLKTRMKGKPCYLRCGVVKVKDVHSIRLKYIDTELPNWCVINQFFVGLSLTIHWEGNKSWIPSHTSAFKN